MPLHRRHPRAGLLLPGPAQPPAPPADREGKKVPIIMGSFFLGWGTAPGCRVGCWSKDAGGDARAWHPWCSSRQPGAVVGWLGGTSKEESSPQKKRKRKKRKKRNHKTIKLIKVITCSSFSHISETFVMNLNSLQCWK